MQYLLNDRQQEACFATDGPLLILAGAGSGKTRVITHRIAYLIEECGVNPYNILAITFTNKAAREMRERVDNLIGFGAESVWVSTFHSMCVRILRKHVEKLGRASAFTIYDTDDSKGIIRDVLKYLGMDPKLYPERLVLSVISKAKEQYMSPDDYEKEHATSYRDQQLASAYREYQKRLAANNAFDFDDLIYQTIFLFETNPDVLLEYQERFRYIMVDEYQDTNFTQFKLVEMLARKYRNICVVGDDDQSIYKFRGADITNILSFENQYEGCKVVKLEQNYRSTSNILNAANHVISHNQGRKDKTLWTEQEEGEKITYTRYGNEYDEATGVASEISKLIDEGQSADEIAVLYRTNAQSRLLEEKMLLANIPYRIYGGQNFYARKEIKDIVCYLKLLVNPSDNESLKRIINVPKRGIGATTVGKVEDFSLENGMSMYDALLDMDIVPGIDRAKSKLSEFMDLMEGIRTMIFDGAFASEAFDKLIEATGYVELLQAEGTEEAKGRIENIDELRNKIVTYEQSAEQPNLTELLEEIALVADTDEEDAEGAPGRVTLMTLHSAKGLEFPNVFITGMEERLFPSGMSMDSDDPDAIEEERRLCYVGITRAMKKLYLTGASQRMIHGITNFCEESEFLDEIPKDYIVRKSAPGARMGRTMGKETEGKPYSNEKHGFADYGYGRPKMKDTDYSKTNPYTKKSANPSANPGFGKAFPMGGDTTAYAVGDTVKHLKFGKGVIKAVTPAGSDQELTVEFERVGEKKLFASLVKMKKL